jgi:hypothetical protein
MIQRKEPFIPAEDGRVPLDAPYEVPDEYCNIHGPITEPINNQEPTNLYENIDQEDRFPEDSADPDVQ